MLNSHTEKLEQENEAYRKLYSSLLDFGQDPRLPVQKLDYVKARVFDCSVMLKRIEKSST